MSDVKRKFTPKTIYRLVKEFVDEHQELSSNNSIGDLYDSLKDASFADIDGPQLSLPVKNKMAD